MIGDQNDFVGRLRRVLPRQWFSDVAPFTNAVLCGLSTAWVAIYALVQVVILQTRIATVTSVFEDMVSTDFFGSRLPRRNDESDTAFRSRIRSEMLRTRATRAALATALTELTSQSVSIFEPARPADTGGYRVGGVGYGVAGGWGNLSLKYQSFVTAKLPEGQGIALLAGYGTGGVVVYGNLSEVTTQVSVNDIYASASAILPAGYVVWLRVTG